MLGNTWIFSWLFTNALLMVYGFLFQPQLAEAVAIMMLLLFTFLAGLPALIPFAIFWFFLKKIRFTKQEILTQNIIAAIIIGFLCGLFPLMIVNNGNILEGLRTGWPFCVFPAAGGALAVWANQREIYKGLQRHFINEDITYNIYD